MPELEPKPPSGRWYLAPLLASLLIRLLCLPLAKVLPVWGDANGYLVLAQEFRDSGTFRLLPSGIRPPIARMLIAPGLDTSVSPAAPFPGVFLIQIAAGVLACALLMILTRRLFGTRAAVAAGWLYALYPQSIAWTSGLVMVETFSVLCGAATLLALDGFARARDRPGAKLWPHTVLLGLLLGIGILTREQLVSVAVATGLALLLTPGRPWLRRAMLTAQVALIALVLTVPWTRHNLAEHGRPILSGSYPELSLMLMNAPPGESGMQLWLDEPTMGRRIDLARSTFRRALFEYPGLTARRAVFRLRALFGPEVMLPTYFAIGFDDSVPTVREADDLFNQNWRLPAGTTGRWVQILCGLATVIIFGLAAAGLAAAGQSAPRRCALIMTLMLVVSIALMVGAARYRHSLLAFMIPFAGQALAMIGPAPGLGALEPRARRLALGWGLGVGLALILTVFVLPAPLVP